MIQAEEKSLKEVQKFKAIIDKRKGKPFSIYSLIKENFGWSPIEVLSALRLGVVTKEHFEGSMTKYVYSWNGGEPDMKLIKKWVQERKNLQNERNRAIRSKKKKKQEQLKANPVAPLSTFIKDNKAEVQASPIKEELAPAQEIVKLDAKPPEKANIPISVEVVSENGKKTVTIKIEV